MHKEIKGSERRGCKRLGHEIEALLRMGCVAPPNASHMVERLGNCITYKVTTNKGIFQCLFFGQEKKSVGDKIRKSATHDFCEENAPK
jgi:hypothetical protein